MRNVLRKHNTCNLKIRFSGTKYRCRNKTASSIVYKELDLLCSRIRV